MTERATRDRGGESATRDRGGESATRDRGGVAATWDRGGVAATWDRGGVAATWVKVCGLTRDEDVAAAVAAGADAVGFVMVTGSPRAVNEDTVCSLAAGVPVTTVLLTDEEAPAAALALVERTGVSGVQPYGREAVSVAIAAAASGHFVLLPGRARPRDWLEGLPAGVHPLVDTPARGLPGGTGRVFDWRDVLDLDVEFVLAGGLGPDNVADAIRMVRPWGVDASSRLESAPGIKDHSKVADFVAEAKAEA